MTVAADDRVVALLLASGARVVPDCECAGLLLAEGEIVVCDICGTPWKVEGTE